MSRRFSVVLLLACGRLGVVADCRTDWSGSCPAGWNELPGHCAATASYAGPCATVLLSAGLSTEGKQHLSQQCGFSWPCSGRDTCPEGVDFAGCPEGWKETSQGLCGAPPQYFGNCRRTLQFEGDDDDEKEDIENQCGVRWPCKRLCSADFSAACPEGWSHLGEQQCLAPKDYHGACLPMQNLAEFTEDQKQGFASACAARWPCQEVVSTGSRCELAESICPEAWETVGGGAFPTYCHSVDYKGPCRSRISADRINELGVDTVMERCGVSWPCAKPEVQISPGSSFASKTKGNEGGPIMDNGFLSAETSRMPKAPPRAIALY